MLQNPAPIKHALQAPEMEVHRPPIAAHDIPQIRNSRNLWNPFALGHSFSKSVYDQSSDVLRPTMSLSGGRDEDVIDMSVAAAMNQVHQSRQVMRPARVRDQSLDVPRPSMSLSGGREGGESHESAA